MPSLSKSKFSRGSYWGRGRRGRGAADLHERGEFAERAPLPPAPTRRKGKVDPAANGVRRRREAARPRAAQPQVAVPAEAGLGGQGGDAEAGGRRRAEAGLLLPIAQHVGHHQSGGERQQEDQRVF